MPDTVISVIIPCYNHGQYLEECLESVRLQTYKNIEIIVVNDGSTDQKTNELIDNLEGIKIVKKQNGGLASARNAGIAVAAGQYILPLDADDKIGASYIEKAINIFKGDAEVKLVFCKGKYFGAENGEMNNSYTCFRDELLYHMIFCSCIFRKADAETAGLYNINMRKGMEDWDFILRFLAGDKKVVQIPEILFLYRRNPGSMWDDMAKNKAIRTEMENLVFKNNIDLYMAEWGSMIDVLREYKILKETGMSAESIQEKIHGTASYRLGHFILSPFKLLRKVFKK